MNARPLLLSLIVGLALVLAGCAADRAYRAGLQHVDKGRYEEGLTSLQEALRLHPDNTQYRSGMRVAREQAVRRLLADAEREMRAGRVAEAEGVYRRILGIDAENNRAQAGLAVIRRARQHEATLEFAQKAWEQKRMPDAIGALRQILSEDPKHAGAAELLYRIEATQVRNAHTPLKVKTRYLKPVSLQFRDANVRMVFEALSRTTGINFIFDNDVKSATRVTVFLNRVRAEDAIELILAQSQLAQKVLNDNTILIYPATPQKQKEYQEQVVKSFYLTNLEPKKAQSMLKTMLDVGTVFVDERSNLLVMRDTAESVRMAEKLLAAADLPEPEVMLEVEVLEIKRATLQQLGIDFPDRVTFSAANAAGATDRLTLRDLEQLNRDRVLVSPISIGVDIAEQESDVNVLASPRIRARNREKARIHIGERVPVITNTVTPIATGTPVVTGSVQYLDVGLKLEIEPVIHLDNYVAIRVNLEVSSIVREVTNPASGSVAYQIGTRNAATILNLRDGETEILGGLISAEERNSSAGIPGLSKLPILGRLFSTVRDDAQKTEIVLTITPRLVRNIVRPQAATSEFWFGTEARKLGKPLIVQPVSRSEGTFTPPLLEPTPVPENDAPPAPEAAEPLGPPVDGAPATEAG